MRRDRHDPPTKTCEVTTLITPGHVPTCAVTDDATSSTPKQTYPSHEVLGEVTCQEKEGDLHDESGWTAENVWDSPNCLLSGCVTIHRPTLGSLELPKGGKGGGRGYPCKQGRSFRFERRTAACGGLSPAPW